MHAKPYIYNIIFASFIELNATQDIYESYKKFMNSELQTSPKWIIGTHDNWKNQNPGGRFGATS